MYSTPFAGRTFAWSRFPLTVNFTGPVVPLKGSLDLGLSIPTAAAVQASGWQPPRHYLPLNARQSIYAGDQVAMAFGGMH